MVDFEHINELDIYFKEIKNIKTLTSHEEEELSLRIKNGDKKALNKLVYYNLKFVVKIAKKYRNRGVPFPDIINEGNLGLIKAAEKFDSTKGVRFVSYAVWWIKNSIMECINNKKEKEFSSDDYILNNLHDDTENNDFINTEFEEELYNIQSRNNSITELMKCLKEREIKILTLFYGLKDGKEMKLEEVGNKMNLTMERVRQIKDQAILKLKCKALSLPSSEFKTLKTLI